MFSSSDEDSKEDAPEERARPRNLWLAPIHALVERDLMWSGYIDPNSRGKPLPQKKIDKIQCEVSDFHSERMKPPPKTSSLKYWAQTSLRYPIMTQATQKCLCIIARSSTSERSFSKAGHIVRAR